MKAAFFLFFSAISMLANAQAASDDPQALYDQGVALRKRGGSRAFQHFKKVYSMTADDPGQWPLRAAALNEMGELMIENSSLAEIEIFDLFKTQISSAPGGEKDSTTANLHFQMGMLYLSLTSSYDSAILQIEKAAQLRSAIFGPQHRKVAECYYQMGNIFKYYLADFSEAERCYERSLRIREQERSSDTLEIARTYYNLATTNRSQEDLERALSYGVTAIELFKKIDHAANVERTYTVVANIYRDMGQWELAAEYYQNAIELNVRVNKSVPDLAWHHVNLGELLKIEGKYDASIDHLKKALSIYDDLRLKNRTLGEDDKFLFLYAQYMLAETYLLAESFTLSFLKFHEHIASLRELNEMTGWQAVDAYLGLGHYYRRTMEFDSALHYYQVALVTGLPEFTDMNTRTNPTPEQVGLRYLVHPALSGKAMVYRARYDKHRSPTDLDLALECLELAEQLLSQQRNSLDTQESKWSFSNDNYAVYEQIVEVLYEKQQLDSGEEIFSTLFNYLERSKARSLAEALSQAQQTNRISSNDSLLRIHANLQRSVFAAQALLDEEVQQSTPDAKAIADLREKIVHLYGRIERNNELLERRFPGYMKVINPRTPTLDDLKTIASESGSVVLDYFWGQHNVYLFATSPDTSAFIRLGDTKNIKTEIEDFIAHFTSALPIASTEPFLDFSKTAHELYLTLLDPVRDMLVEKARLLIVPDGLLSQLPFEALTLSPAQTRSVDYKNLDYLIRHHTTGYIYATAIRLGRPAKNNGHSNVLGMAFTGTASRSKGLSRLPGADAELKVIEKRWSDGKFLRGGEVTESNFKSLAPDYGIIHLAVHGMGDVGKRYSSRLFFEEESASPEDGELHAYELYGMVMNANLAVLSACESGLGKSFRGESMLSMASAFTLAGCANTVFSLWKVNDKVSVQLIDNFYSELAKGRDIDEALHISKNRYLQQADELTAHPRLWASLVSYGDQTRIIGKRFPYYIPVGVGVGILLVSLWMRRRNFFRAQRQS